jgi:hypothetical protein
VRIPREADTGFRSRDPPGINRWMPSLETAKERLGSIAFFSTSTALKFKDRPNFFPVQEVWRAAISFFDQLFLDVEPAFAFARFGQLDGSPKHLLVFFPHRASGIRFRSIIRLGLNLQSQSTCQALRSREPEMRKNGTPFMPTIHNYP